MGSLANSCEGTNGVAFSNSNSAGPNQFNAVTVTGTGTTLTYDNTHAHTGSTAAKVSLASGVSSTAFLDWSALPNTPTANCFVRAYFYLTALPPVNAILAKFLDGASVESSIQLQTTGILRTLTTAGGTISSLTESFPLNQWVRVEFEVTGISGVNGTVACRIFSGANLETNTPDSGGSVSASSAALTGTVTDLRVGTSSAVSETGGWAYWIDDVAYSDVATPGPLVTAAPFIVTGGRVARRSPARAVWDHAAGPQPPAPPAGVPGTAPAHLVVARRAAARAVWRGTVSRTTNLLPGNQPGGMVRRRTAGRGTWRGWISRTVNASPAQPVSGTAPAHLVVARRAAARAVWRGTVSRAVNAASAPAPAPRGRPVVARRTAARGWFAANAAQANAAPLAPGAGVTQDHLVVARRAAARAVWRGTVSRTTNLLPGNQPGGMVRRRQSSRVVWRGTTARTVNAAPPPPANGTAPAHLVVARRLTARGYWRGNAVPGITRPPAVTGGQVRRRRPAGGQWRGYVSRTVNALPPPFTIGALSAADEPASLLTGATASNALTGSTAAAGVLTGSDQRTGGPS